MHNEDLSGLEKFEAPDPVEWCPRGYILVQPDARGCYKSEGDIAILGTQVIPQLLIVYMCPAG